MKKILFTVAIVLISASVSHSQVPASIAIQILKAEDARRFDSVIEGLLRSPNLAVREQAALAAGRIGDDRAIPVLGEMFGDKRNAGRVWTMAVFAIGEIESVKGAEHIITVIKSESGYVKRDAALLSRAFEAAGKIAAANPKDLTAQELGEVILKGLEIERNSASPSVEVIRRGVTAVMRARPADGDKAIKPFLAYSDPGVVADTLNALVRLRSKNASRDALDLLETSVHPLIRANAARLLGAAEDKDSIDILLKAATTDQDSRVRVSAIRALGSLKDAKAAYKLLERGRTLMGNYQYQKTENRREKNECLELATTLGRLLAGTKNEKAVKFLTELTRWGLGRDPEVAIAWATIDPESFLQLGAVTVPQDPHSTGYDWRFNSSQAQGLAVLAKSDDKNIRKAAADRVAGHVEYDKSARLMEYMSIPDDLQALAEFKPADLDATMRTFLKHDDVLIRATAAGILADLPPSKENVDALDDAFNYSLLKDKVYNDAMLSIMDALFKLDKKASVGSLLLAVNGRDYLVRKKAFELLADKDLQKDFPGIPMSLEIAKTKHNDQVQPYLSAFGTKLGQLLNSDLDYRRALSRKNGSVKAVLTTENGTFAIVFNPEEAPLTVDNWVRLARSGYFNGLEVHRVVPNFVMQDGDPRGDGNGGPGWSIRCEVNMLPYDRGAVGMALSGKDTGGSQWFVTHSPQPHLDGGYTVFGHVSEADMKVVDNIVRGDKILKVTIVGK